MRSIVRMNEQFKITLFKVRCYYEIRGDSRLES
jgi:hypothetical protein